MIRHLTCGCSQQDADAMSKVSGTDGSVSKKRCRPPEVGGVEDEAEAATGSKGQKKSRGSVAGTTRDRHGSGGNDDETEDDENDDDADNGDDDGSKQKQKYEVREAYEGRAAKEGNSTATTKDDAARTAVVDLTGDSDDDKDGDDEDITEDMVGPLLGVWGTLRRAANALQIPDFSLENVLALIDAAAPEAQTPVVAPTALRAAGDVVIGALQVLAADSKAVDKALSAVSVLNVHTWPEALRLYLAFAAEQPYRLLVSCGRGEQNEQCSEVGAEERALSGPSVGEQRRAAMEDEVAREGACLGRIAEHLRVAPGGFWTLPFRDRFHVISVLMEQMLTTSVLRARVEAEAEQLSSLRRLGQEFMVALQEEEAATSEPGARAATPGVVGDAASSQTFLDGAAACGAAAGGATVNAGAGNVQEASKGEAQARAEETCKMLTRIVRPLQALQGLDGAPLRADMPLLGKEVLIVGRADGSAMPEGVHTIGVICRTFFVGWCEVRRKDGVAVEQANGAGEDAPKEMERNRQNLLLPNHVADQQTRRLLHAAIKACKVQAVAHLYRRKALLGMRIDPFGVDRTGRRYLRIGGDLMRVFTVQNGLAAPPLRPDEARERWGVYLPENLDDLTAALDLHNPQEKSLHQQLRSVGSALHAARAAAKAAGDPGMAERPLEPRDGYDALDPAQREQRNGRLCAHEHLPPLPGEIWCEITGEALDRAQHHCTVTFATFPKSLLQKKKKSASYVWQQHLAAIRAAFLKPAPTGAGTTLDEFSRVLHARWASETSASPPQCPQSGNPQSGYQMQS